MKPTALGTELSVNRGRMKPRSAHDDGLSVILQRRSETDGLLLGTAGGALFRGAVVLLPLPPARRCVERLLLGTLSTSSPKRAPAGQNSRNSRKRTRISTSGRRIEETGKIQTPRD